MSNLILGIILIFGCSVLSFLAGGIYGVLKTVITIAREAKRRGKEKEFLEIVEKQ